MVLIVETNYGVTLRNKIDIHNRGQNVTGLKLAHQLPIQTRIQSQNSALIINDVPLVLPDTNL